MVKKFLTVNSGLLTIDSDQKTIVQPCLRESSLV
jgi:hypothetical protein